MRELKRQSEAAWASADVILTPTAGTIYKILEVESDPIRLNANLGFYTNFMNLFDLSGVAVPAGARGDGLPFGITLVGHSGADRELLALAALQLGNADFIEHACRHLHAIGLRRRLRLGLLFLANGRHPGERRDR